MARQHLCVGVPQQERYAKEAKMGATSSNSRATRIRFHPVPLASPQFAAAWPNRVPVRLHAWPGSAGSCTIRR